ncbi:MAG: protein kinase, partial [bacterium]|nr:protein kinase [bacterium]
MTAERWTQIKTILQAALELSEHERAAYLEEACGTDQELRREVETLLTADQDRIRFLDRPVSRLLDEDPPEVSLVGQRIGQYTLQQELGRGGIGSVCLAVRADDEFERQVAIKVLKRGMDTDEIVRRFRAERQILANLDHPYITKLHEGGTTDDGRPYFIMEYV